MNKELRHISYCLIALLLFVACRKESHPNTPEEPEQPEQHYPICMDASSNGMSTSRALVTDDATLQGTDLGVFAYKQLADGTKVSVFDNEKVYYNGSVWTYDNTKYWDRAATSYYFVSYSPQLTDADVEFHKEADQLYIKNIPNWQAIDANAKDYVAAKHRGAVEGGYITANGVQPVPLDFSHILCQLEVKVVKNPFLVNTYTLSGISYTNVPEKEGTATYTYHPQGGNDVTGAPTVTEGTMTVATTGQSMQMATLDKVPVPTTEADDKTATTIKHLVAPFNSTENFNITLTYQINDGEDKTATVDTQLNQLEESKRYVLTLTFNSGAEISATVQVLDWVNVPVEEEDKHNW